MSLSAVDVISPAFRRTTDLLFKPFRFRMWTRLAVIALLAGELTGGSGNFNYNIPQQPTTTSPGSEHLLALPGSPMQIALLVTLLVASGAVLLVFLAFVNSVFRFLLLDVTLSGRYHLREGWRRWVPEGTRYFWWQLGFMAVSLAALALLIGLPLLVAWRAGLFHEPRQHLAALILGGLVLFVLFLGYLLAFGVTGVLAKDLVVAIMAAEKLGPLAAWRRLIPMMRATPGSYAGYLGMKIVLAIAAGIAFGILDVVLFLLLLIPGAGIGVLVFLVIKALGLTWNPLTIALVVVLGGVAALGLVFLFALINMPAAVFFEFYVVLFFASRYPPLEAMMQPAVAPSAPPAEPLPPPAPAPA